MLSTNGYRVLAANNGAEAISIFGDNLVDLVLADFAMPQMNGDQLIRRLKQIAAMCRWSLWAIPENEGQIHAADALLVKKPVPTGVARVHQVRSARKRGREKACSARHRAQTSPSLPSHGKPESVHPVLARNGTNSSLK